MWKVWRPIFQPSSVYFRRPYSLSASLRLYGHLARFKLGEWELESALTCAGSDGIGFPLSSKTMPFKDWMFGPPATQAGVVRT